VHEDVEFLTESWGALLVDHFRSVGPALIGVAGGDAKGLPPGSWSVPMKSNELNIVQYDRRSRNEEHVRITGSTDGDKRMPVTALDGVLLCTTRSVFNEACFDEWHFRGFHGYDLDFSLQIGQRFPLFVVPDVLLRHFSTGNPDRRWMEAAVEVSRKWRRTLPRSVHEVPKKEWVEYHWRCMQVFTQHLVRLRYTPLKIAAYIIEFSCNRYFRPRRLLSLGRFLWSQRALGKQRKAVEDKSRDNHANEIVLTNGINLSR
jgi:hypothetical protein